MKSRWHRFYADRVNSTYQDYFEKRYKPLLSIVHNYNTVVEEGVGIGSVSKYLISLGISTIGIDKCPDMVKLCQKNNPTMKVFCGDMFNFTVKAGIVVTHGVLEHYSDEDIKSLLLKYRNMNQRSVHYVPTDGYDKPSFGDERLLPYQYWLDNFNPTDYRLFNENKDLVLIFDHT